MSVNGVKFNMPDWFDETAQYGFFFHDGVDIISEAIFAKTFRTEEGRFAMPVFKKFILHMYEVEGNTKAELLLDAAEVMEITDGIINEDRAMEILASFDYLFGNLCTKILS